MTRITAYKQLSENGFKLEGPFYDLFTLTCPDGTVRNGLMYRRDILGAANDYLRAQEKAAKPARIKTAKAALEAFGPEGTRPLTGVRLIQNARSSWSVQTFHTLDDQPPAWVSMAHFCHASEVVEWANRYL